jgi:hypothetical protein
MPTDLLIRTSDATARLGIDEVTQHLLDKLGPTLTAFLAASRDRKLPYKWAKPLGEPGHVDPQPERVTRLRAAHSIWDAISKKECELVARAWFLSSNPRLDSETPVGLLREGRVPEVMSAAGAFLEGTYNA